MATPQQTPQPAGPQTSATAIALAHAPLATAAFLRALVPPSPPPAGQRRLWRWGSIAVLVAASWLCVALDRWAGFPGAAFAWLVPFTWLGVITVFSVLHPLPPRRADWLRGFGCLTVLATLLGVFVLWLLGAIVRTYVVGASGSHSWGLWMFGTLVVLIVGALVARATHAAPHTPKADQATRLRAAAELVEALADDAVAGKPTSGFIDVGGHEQPSKLVRSGTSASGWKVSLYRDEWLRLRLILRDGNRLRISLVDRVKARAGRWKKGRSGKSKWKEGRSQWLSTLELQLVVNPTAYRVKAASSKAEAAQASARPGAGQVLTLAQPSPSKSFDPADVLRAVAALYGRLERLEPRGQARS